VVDKHYFNLLSCPILYITPFLIVKGATLLVNLCFCHANKKSSICFVCKKFLTLFNYSGYVKKKLASMICFGNLVNSMVSSNLDKAYAFT